LAARHLRFRSFSLARLAARHLRLLSAVRRSLMSRMPLLRVLSGAPLATLLHFD
jgi:hypothetical protein